MTEKKTDVNKDLDNISEAETIKDSDSVTHEEKGGNFNDDTEIENEKHADAKETVNMEEKFEESEI